MRKKRSRVFKIQSGLWTAKLASKSLFDEKCIINKKEYNQFGLIPWIIFGYNYEVTPIKIWKKKNSWKSTLFICQYFNWLPRSSAHILSWEKNLQFKRNGENNSIDIPPPVQQESHGQIITDWFHLTLLKFWTTGSTTGGHFSRKILSCAPDDVLNAKNVKFKI